MNKAAAGQTEGKIFIGFSVPKKRIQLAVHRNRIRRLMREAVRKNFHDLKCSDGQYTVQIVVMFKGSGKEAAKELTAETIEQDWKKLQQHIQTMI